MVEKLMNDMTTAMKNEEKERLAVIRMVKDAMDKEYINSRREIDDKLLIEVVQKQIKLRRRTIIRTEDSKRNDLIEKTREEIKILEEYLPKKISLEEINESIDETLALVKPNSIKDIGKVMKVLTIALDETVDMKMVSDIIKEKLK